MSVSKDNQIPTASKMETTEEVDKHADSSIHVEKPDSPALSCVSMKSDRSMRDRPGFSKDFSIHFEKPDSSAPSCVSMKSDKSMRDRPGFSKEDLDPHDCPESMVSCCQKMDGNAIFELVEVCSTKIFASELRRYKRMLFPDLKESSENKSEDSDILATEDIKADNSAREGALQITLHILKEIGQSELANTLEKQIYGELDVCQRKLKLKLKKLDNIDEGIPKQGQHTLLSKVYTELYITEGDSGAVNNEHEVRQIEKATRKPHRTQDKPIKCEDIFNPLFGQDKLIRTVLTKGIAGIGKTISVHKFNLEWAEGRANQDIQLLINLPFRELNLMKERKYTLIQLLHHFLVEAKESGILDFGKYKLVFIFDGLDECRLLLDFDHNETCCSISQPATVDVLLTNLIKGNLLPSAHIWITTRPAAANRIPPEFVDRVTEIRGFNDPQKEEYFRKKIPDQNMANSVILHVKSSRSIHIMCHIPVFSWISATVLERILQEAAKNRGEEWDRGEMPKTLTEMYTNFLVINTLMKNRKYSAGEETGETESQVETDEEMILKLGKLAFEHLIEGTLIFYKEDLRECNINVTDAAVHSGLVTQILKNDVGLHQTKVYCFVHLSIQEFLAALYVFHTFVCYSQNLLEPQEVEPQTKDVTILHKSAVDRALQSNNGHLDLFLRFLLGLSQPSNQTLLQSILTTVGSSSHSNEDTAEYIKEKIRQNPSPERCINLFHCLSELNDQSLMDEIQNYLQSGSLSETKLSPSQWSALVFVLLTSKEELDVFDLRKYSRSEEGLLRLLPVIKESRVVLLKECNLTGKCCEALASTLSSNTSCIRELDLSNNDLQNSGVELLANGLASSTCQVEKLRLSFCGITEKGCVSLASALRSNPSHLKELDLSYNHPGESGEELLTALQKDLGQLSVSLTGNAERFLKSALRKYAYELTLDIDTAHSLLSFSEDNKKMVRMETAQLLPDSPERFTDWGQVLCKEGLTGRCYWEAEWTGEWTGIGVAYKGISRNASGNDSVLGYNDKSWSLRFCNGKYTAWYNKNDQPISVPYFITKRVGVYLDWPAGTLSFYAVSSNTMTHLHTFQTTFTGPLYPGFRLGFADTSLSLCKVEYPPNTEI